MQQRADSKSPVTELFASGHIVDLILGLMMIEAAALIASRYRTRRGLAPADVVWNLLAGASLMLALRAALVDAGWHWVALCLSLSLIAHVTDFWRRSRG